MSPPIFIPAEAPESIVGEPAFVTNSVYRSTINFQKFPFKKAQEVFRIFVAGGSAAYGWPGRADTSFTGILQRAFSAIHPGRIDIVNTAGMSFGSRRVRDTVNQLLLHEPDLIIVYGGNNEYVETNLYPQEELPEWLRATRNGLRRLDVYRALRLALFRLPPVKRYIEGRSRDITSTSWAPRVSRGTVDRNILQDPEIIRNFKGNIKGILKAAGEKKVPVLLMTVPVNMTDWLPTDSPEAPAGRDLSRERELWEVATSAAYQEDFQKAADLFGALEKLRPQSARMKYFLGNSLREMGKLEEARNKLQEAIDLDARPLRARSTINEALLEVSSDAGVKLLDLAGIFAERSEGGITTSRLFVDYCHPNREGHKIIAREVLINLERLLPFAASVEEVQNLIDADDYEPQDSDYKVNQLYARGMTLQHNGFPEMAEEVYRQLLGLAPDHSAALANLGTILFKRGQHLEAKQLFRLSLEKDPANTVPILPLGQIALAEGDLEKGRELFNRVIHLNPFEYQAFLDLGVIDFIEGKYGNAIKHFNEAERIGLPDFRLFRYRGEALLRKGEGERAVKDLEKAAAMNPSDRKIKELLEMAAKSFRAVPTSTLDLR